MARTKQLARKKSPPPTENADEGATSDGATEQAHKQTADVQQDLLSVGQVQQSQAQASGGAQGFTTEQEQQYANKPPSFQFSDKVDEIQDDDFEKQFDLDFGPLPVARTEGKSKNKKLVRFQKGTMDHEEEEALVLREVSLSNSKLLDSKETDFFNILFAINAMTFNPRTDHINELTLTGVEQITDLFFLAWKVEKMRLAGLKSLTISGCPYVTDQGIQWLSEVPDITVKEVSLLGCRNLTQRSLSALFEMPVVPDSIDMQLTSVSVLPMIPSCSVKLEGCPMISPPLSKFLNTTPQHVMSNTTLLPYDNFKLVVLHSPNSDIKTGIFTKKPLDSDFLTVEKSWRPESSSHRYNVYEGVTGTGCEDLVLSNGCVVILPFSDTEDVTAKNMATQIITIVAQYPEIVFVLCDLSPDADDTRKALLDKVREILKISVDFLARSRTYRRYADAVTLVSRSVLQDHHFDDQLQMGYNQALMDNLSTMSDSGLTSVSLVKDPKYTFLRMAQETLVRLYPWHNDRFVTETLQAFEALTAKPRALASLMDVTKACPVGVLKDFAPQLGCLEISKAMEILHIRGSCVYLPSVDRKPAICDITCLPSLVCLEGKATHRADIPGVGQDVPCWRRDDFRFVLSGKEGSTNLLLDILMEHGLLFRFPCSVKGSKFTDTIVYVCTQDLPDTPDVPVDEVWLPDLPSGDQQRDMYFTFPALPNWLFPCFLRKLQETSQLVLMWRSGAVLRQGPVMVLVELLTNETCHDLPTIVISTRVQREAMYKTLCVAFTNAKMVLSGLMNRRRVFAVKTVCCTVCNPTKNRRHGLSATHACCHGADLTYRNPYLYDKSLPCRKSNSGAIMTETDVLDPGKKPTAHIPNHTDMKKIVSTNTHESMDKSLRCHLCNNCGQNGIGCQGNLQPGSTNKHCSCNHTLSLCSFCGICQHCIQVLAEAYSQVHPSFRPSPTNKSSSVGSILGNTEFGPRQMYEFPDQLSLAYFNQLNLGMLTENCDFLINIYSPGMAVDYKTAKGIITVNGEQRVQEVKCEFGDHLELKVLFQTQDNAQKEVLEIRKNDVTVMSVALIDRSAKVKVTQRFSSKLLVYIPNLMAMESLDANQQSQKEEVPKVDEDGSVVKCCGAFPTVMERRMSFIYPHIEDILLLTLSKHQLGKTGVILPQGLTLNSLLYPSMTLLKRQLLYHPICPYNVNTKVPKVKPVHLVNGEGIILRDKLADILNYKTLLLATHLLFIHSNMDLPRYDRLLPELSAASDRKFTYTQIRDGVQEVLRLAAVNMAYSLDSNFGLENFQKNTIISFTQSPMMVHGKLKKAIEQNIEKCGLVKVSGYKDAFNFTGIFYCPAHVACNQKDCFLSTLPKAMFGFYPVFVTSIKLQKNQLTTIPAEFFPELTQLRLLDLRENLLESLPDTIGQCRNLEKLHLCENNLLDLPSTLDGCKSLFHLDIGKNMMAVLPAVITKLYNLRVLDGSSLMLTSLPDNFGNLSKLSTLNLSGNCLTKLPQSFVMLQNLEVLSLAGIRWMENKANHVLSKERVREFLEKNEIKRLFEANADKIQDNEMFEVFDMDGNQTLDTQEIARANAILFEVFPRFGFKSNSGHDKFTPDEKTPSGFPEEILSLKNLKYLDLRYQGLVQVPPKIQNLEKLDRLRVASNPYLLSIAAETGCCPLSSLELDDCPLLKTPPKEIRERGFKTTFAYLKRLLTGSVDCKRTKLMLVGLGGAGKTSLVNALKTIGQDESNLTGADAITDGIDICTWNVDYNGEVISYSVWDFAGQTVYYNTHQFFLSDRAVYLLLWNIRLGYEHAGLNFWLNSITVHAPKAPIFVVGTHMDQMTKVELPMDDLSLKYHQIQGFHYVSSKDGKGIPELKDDLFRVTRQQEYMGEKIPQAWLQLEDIISKEKVENSVNVLDLKDVESKAVEVGIIDSTEVTQAIQFLHDLGLVQHFSNEYLKAHVVINPQWIVDVMACVVSVKQSVIKNGRLMHSSVGTIWKDYLNMADWLLRLTEEFDLTFQLEKEQCNIVPCLLPDKRPEFTWPEVKKNDGILETKLVYMFDYLPAGLFNRGQVRLSGLVEECMIWKRGSFLKKNGQLALVQQIGESELNVKVQGPRPDNLLFFIYEVFESLIKESFHGVVYECKIPCPHCVEEHVKEPHMFQESVIRCALEVKAPFLQCHKKFHSTSVVDLQGILAPDNSDDYDVHMSQDVVSLQQIQKTMAVDIFMSYCIKDAPQDRSKVIHPEDVCSDLEKEGYSCCFPRGKELESREAMAKRLVHASILMVFVSNDYAEDDVCCDMYKYGMCTMKKPTIVVTIGENFDWMKSSSLGVFMSDVLFVNMINTKKPVYKSKFAELLTSLRKDDQVTLGKEEGLQPCFISYCWLNSRTAVALGSRSRPGAVGDVDPREMKDFLEDKGIGCWLDVEQVNVTDQLFVRIARGISDARIMVACVSDEYARSENCLKELRFAIQIGLPVIIVEVGTGSDWKTTEVGFLTMTFRRINIMNLQEKPQAFDRLLEMIQEIMSSPESQRRENQKKRTKEPQQEKEKKKEEMIAQMSFEEVYELAQRKFLRQISTYAGSHSIGNYPRLFVLDIIQSTDPDKIQYTVYTLCECPELNITHEDLNIKDFDKYCLYLTHITMVMEHNPGFVLNLFSDAEGQKVHQRIQGIAANCTENFQTSYQKLRMKVFELDVGNQEKGQLKRCRLPTGNTIWLCEEHSAKMKVTVLSEEVADVHTVVNQPWLDAMLDCLKAGQKHPFEFQKNKKAKRIASDRVAKVEDVERKLKRSVSRTASRNWDVMEKDMLRDLQENLESEQKAPNLMEEKELSDKSQNEASALDITEKQEMRLEDQKELKRKEKKRRKKKRKERDSAMHVESSDHQRQGETLAEDGKDVEQMQKNVHADEKTRAVSFQIPEDRAPSPTPQPVVGAKFTTPTYTPQGRLQGETGNRGTPPAPHGRSQDETGAKSTTPLPQGQSGDQRGGDQAAGQETSDKATASKSCVLL